MAQPQQPGKVWRLGVLDPGSSTEDAARRAQVMQLLRDVGYVEHQNLLVERRYAEGRTDRLPMLARELVQLKVDLIFTGTTPAAQAARQATDTIPIVFTSVADPVGVGLVTSLGRPGANITGVSSQMAELWGKRLQLLKESLPHARRVAVLWNPANAASAQGLRDAEAIASSLGLTIAPLGMANPGDVEVAFATLNRDRPDAVEVHPTPPMWDLRRRIMEFAATNRLPTFSANREMARAGALMTYGPDFQDQRRQAVALIVKIFKGAKPADLPVEQPRKFELVINLKTAKTLGVTIPPSVLLRADEVID
jgi:putative ABC transport system substrate-binding protein